MCGCVMFVSYACMCGREKKHTHFCLCINKVDLKQPCKFGNTVFHTHISEMKKNKHTNQNEKKKNETRNGTNQRSSVGYWYLTPPVSPIVHAFIVVDVIG